MISQGNERDTRNVLAVLLDLPTSLAKSAHMLVLKRLQEHGWNVTVLTLKQSCEPDKTEWCGIKIVSATPCTPHWQALMRLSEMRSHLPRRAIETVDWLRRPLKPLAGFPDSLAPIRKDLVQQARRLLREDEYHAVLSLYYPFTSHLVAHDVAQREQIPWIALTKDFYSWPVTTPKSRGSFANGFKRSYEARVLRKADTVAAVNDNIANYLRAMLPRVPVVTLAHCFDDEDFPGGDSAANTSDNIFRLVSVGKTDRSEHSELLFLFQSVGELLQEGLISPQHFRMRFVGYGGDLVADCAHRTNCVEILETVRQVPHAAAIEEMRRATCLLFQQAPWGNRRRLAEYLATRRPILAFPRYPDVMSERWLNERGGTEIANTIPEIKKVIVDWYGEFITHGKVDFRVDEKAIKRFSASHRAEELNELLQNCLRRRRTSNTPLKATKNSGRFHCARGFDSNGQKPQPCLDGVLATFRREQALSETLEKLLSQGQSFRRLCIVDNEPTPQNLETIEHARQNCPETEIVYLPTEQNIGNAGAWALGLEQLVAQARNDDWIVILDDNNPPEENDELQKLFEFASRVQGIDPSLGGVGISGARFDWNAGLLRRIKDRELVDTVHVDYLAAGFLSMYSVRAIRSVGTFCSELFFGNVEIEYGLRMRRAGYQLVANGDLWLNRRQLWNRCNSTPQASLLCSVHWQRYYRIRNYIHMMRTFGRSDLALRWAIIQCLAKPAYSFFKSPLLGWQGLTQAARATYDGFAGRLGRTVEPDCGQPRHDWTLHGNSTCATDD